MEQQSDPRGTLLAAPWRLGILAAVAVAAAVLPYQFLYWYEHHNLKPVGLAIAGVGLIIIFGRRIPQVADPWTAVVKAGWRILPASLIVFGLIITMADFVKPFSLWKFDRAISDVRVLTRAVESYRLRFGSYPPTLGALMHPPDGGKRFMESEQNLIDPWGRPYGYAEQGPWNHGRRPDIWSETPEDEVIGNWMWGK